MQLTHEEIVICGPLNYLGSPDGKGPIKHTCLRDPHKQGYCEVPMHELDVSRIIIEYPELLERHVPNATLHEFPFCPVVLAAIIRKVSERSAFTVLEGGQVKVDKLPPTTVQLSLNGHRLTVNAGSGFFSEEK